MDKIFSLGIALCLVAGMVFNQSDAMMHAILQTPQSVYELSKTLILSCCLWNGIFNIISHSHLLNYLSIVLRPCLKLIYKHVDNEEVYLALSSNILANLLGLGTLATLSGLKAVKRLNNKKDICMLVVINTAGLSLIPSTLMTLRAKYQSQDILVFYPYSLCIGVLITMLGITLVRVFVHE